MSSATSIIEGFGLFALFHSLLLTDAAHRLLALAVGAEREKRIFRAAYCAAATLWFAIYAIWAATLPDEEWFTLTGSAAAILWGVRLLGLWLLWWGVRQFGLASFFGLKDLGGNSSIDAGPIVATGPYQFIRHPLYAAGLLIFWGDPSVSANSVAFTVAASIYLIVGAKVEERRLLRRMGAAYRKYMEEVPGLVPRLWE